MLAPALDDCPLVAVNAGSMELLLGWEIFRVAGVSVPLPDDWLLRHEGALAAEDVVRRPLAAAPGLPAPRVS